MTQYNIVKQPDIFVYGEDFDIFMDRFEAYLTNTNAVKTSHYTLLLSYVDGVSFRKLRSLQFTDEHKTEDVVDLKKARKLLKSVLQKQTTVPYSIQMKYRTQKDKESITDFGYEIQVLAQKAEIENVDTSREIIEAFCSGLNDSQLAAKMLLKLDTFTSLKDAIEYAMQRESTQKINDFITVSRRTQLASEKSVNILANDFSEIMLDEKEIASSSNDTTNKSTEESGQNSYRRGTAYSNRYRGGTNQQQSREQRTCRYCHIRGHLVRDCYKRKNDYSKRQLRNTRFNNQHTPRFNTQRTPRFNTQNTTHYNTQNTSRVNDQFLDHRSDQ